MSKKNALHVEVRGSDQHPMLARSAVKVLSKTLDLLAAVAEAICDEEQKSKIGWTLMSASKGSPLLALLESDHPMAADVLDATGTLLDDLSKSRTPKLESDRCLKLSKDLGILSGQDDVGPIQYRVDDRQMGATLAVADYAAMLLTSGDRYFLERVALDGHIEMTSVHHGMQLIQKRGFVVKCSFAEGLFEAARDNLGCAVTVVGTAKYDRVVRRAVEVVEVRQILHRKESEGYLPPPDLIFGSDMSSDEIVRRLRDGE
ncbi:MAG: hypothetical protein DRQ55_12710 [Planctomycetota bacterium]|nr:MAG: hypothetical protein DRQ55_12710 [Planctomycetota bacterium]RKZ06809.1 MAG: hypothetical protein DRQ32_10735 [bacterium]